MAEIVNMPKLGFDMAEGTLIRWSKQEGENVKKGEVLAEIETDKATVEVESSYEGMIYRQLVEENSIVPVGTPIAVVADPGEKVDESSLPGLSEQADSLKEAASPEKSMPGKAERVVSTEKESIEEDFIKASPLAKKIARDYHIPLAELEGTGPGGRIVKRDVESLIKSGPAPALSEKTSNGKATEFIQPLISSADIPEDRKIPINRLRGIIGQRMTQAKQTVPHFYITHDVDASALLKLYKEISAYLPEEQKISINDFIVKATALSLRKFPNLNASINQQEIIQHGHVNVGVAVAVEGGLMTVVCKDADVKPLRMISAEIKDMVQRARQGKVKPSDIKDSTFSISNLGMYDVDDFIAIINPPEAAILAVGSARKVPVFVGDEVKPGHRMKVTLSADHRVTDGAEGARFLQDLALYLEQPARLLL